MEFLHNYWNIGMLSRIVLLINAVFQMCYITVDIVVSTLKLVEKCMWLDYNWVDWFDDLYTLDTFVWTVITKLIQHQN